MRPTIPTSRYKYIRRERAVVDKMGKKDRQWIRRPCNVFCGRQFLFCFVLFASSRPLPPLYFLFFLLPLFFLPFLPFLSIYNTCSLFWPTARSTWTWTELISVEAYTRGMTGRLRNGSLFFLFFFFFSLRWFVGRAAAAFGFHDALLICTLYRGDGGGVTAATNLA